MLSQIIVSADGKVYEVVSEDTNRLTTEQIEDRKQTLRTELEQLESLNKTVAPVDEPAPAPTEAPTPPVAPVQEAPIVEQLNPVAIPIVLQ